MILNDKIEEAERHLNRASLVLIDARKKAQQGCRESAQGLLADANKHTKAALIFMVKT